MAGNPDNGNSAGDDLAPDFRSNPAIPSTMPGRRGGTLRRGGPNPGAGRKPSNFRKMCGDAVDAHVLPKAQQVVAEQEPDLKRGRPNPTWWAAAAYLAKYGKTEPPKEVQVAAVAEIVVRAVRE